MLQNTSKTLGFQKIMVYKTPPGGGGKPYLARGLITEARICEEMTLIAYLFIILRLQNVSEPAPTSKCCNGGWMHSNNVLGNF